MSAISSQQRLTTSQTIIGTVVDDFQSGGAYIGTSPWAYGGVWRPETQHANEFGMVSIFVAIPWMYSNSNIQVWAGDPPHESPGWYDLYDTDNAMNIIAAQQTTIADWIQGHGKNGTDC